MPCIECLNKTECTKFDCENAISGRYYNNLLNKCDTCIYPCATCNDNKTCITCGYMSERRVKNNACLCADTFYEYG